MTPLPYRVIERREETVDTVTLTLEARSVALPPWSPGQFTMVYAFGVGEVPISVSGGDETGAGVGLIRHTVRAVGAVSGAICAAPVGSTLGLRGPYGNGWPPPPDDADVVVVAGGIGLAPLRPIITAALRRPGSGRTAVLIGARTPADLMFTSEYEQWRGAGAQVLVTVDQANPSWTGHVGVVTTLLNNATFGPAVGYVCGPEVMIRLGARALVERGVAPARISVSLERNMRCGVALCGHCQLGPLLVCRDGPAAGFDRAGPLLATREL